MADILDGLNKAKDVLQDLGGKAVDGAKDLYEKAKPTVEDTFDKVSDGAKDLYEKAKPGLENAFDKMADGAKDVMEKVSGGAKNLAEKAGGEGENEPDLKAQILEEVKTQVAQMREAAATGTDPIHDYIQNKYARAEEKPEEVETDDAQTLEQAATDAAQAAEKAENAARDALNTLGANLDDLAEKVRNDVEDDQ